VGLVGMKGHPSREDLEVSLPCCVKTFATMPQITLLPHSIHWSFAFSLQNQSSFLSLHSTPLHSTPLHSTPPPLPPCMTTLMPLLASKPKTTGVSHLCLVPLLSQRRLCYNLAGPLFVGLRINQTIALGKSSLPHCARHQMWA